VRLQFPNLFSILVVCASSIPSNCQRSKDKEVQFSIAAAARHLALKEIGWIDFTANDPRHLPKCFHFFQSIIWFQLGCFALGRHDQHNCFILGLCQVSRLHQTQKYCQLMDVSLGRHCLAPQVAAGGRGRARLGNLAARLALAAVQFHNTVELLPVCPSHPKHCPSLH
jgi:hypothetical protein